jgi:hypothetical protein
MPDGLIVREGARSGRLRRDWAGARVRQPGLWQGFGATSERSPDLREYRHDRLLEGDRGQREVDEVAIVVEEYREMQRRGQAFAVHVSRVGECEKFLEELIGPQRGLKRDDHAQVADRCPGMACSAGDGQHLAWRQFALEVVDAHTAAAFENANVSACRG